MSRATLGAQAQDTVGDSGAKLAEVSRVRLGDRGPP